MQVPKPAAAVAPVLARARELQASEPIVAYFCKLHAAEQILESKVHLTDTEVAGFVSQLLNEIEAARDSPELSTPQAKEILQDEEAARAYISNFASSIFDRADKAVREKRASKATASGFVAAASLLDLERMWQELSSETKDQIKYAKFQATRILKALKAGDDPNVGEEAEQAAEQAAAVEPEEKDDGAIATAEEEAELAAAAGPDAIDKTPEPDAKDSDHTPQLPSAPNDRPYAEDENVNLPATPAAPPNDLGLPLTPGSRPSVPFDYPSAPKEPDFNEISKRQASEATPEPAAAAPRAAAPVKHTPLDAKSILAEANASKDAQKHARYAISALNYDDMTTAISELQQALAVLNQYQSQG